MQNCRFCGSSLPDNASFCGNCGSPIADSAQKAMDVTDPSSGSGLTLDTPPLPSEYDETLPVLPDIISPGMLIGEGQAPPTGNVPMVHGAPQVGGVPTVQGTPPLRHPRPAATTPERHLHHPQYHHYPFIPHIRRPRTRLRQGAPSKVVVGTTTKWIIVVVAAITVIAASGIVTVLAVPPALSLTGGSTVISGGILHVHGKGFLPGGRITLTLDNGLPVSSIHHNPTRVTAFNEIRGASSASTLQMLLTEQSVPQAASNATISVSTLGTFDATVQVSANWSLGLHTIHATESFGARTAELSFTIIAAPKLLIQQKKLTAGARDCLTIHGSGNLIRGWLCSVTLSTDSGDLNWSASSTNPSDQFTPSKGVVHPNHPESVTIFIRNEPRCTNATFTFGGSTNTVSVSWSCPTH
jgi:hypothetical protein